MVSRWGALYNITKVLNNRYSGSVFVRMGASGHLFNQHYLSVIFPLPSKSTKKANGNVSNGIQAPENRANGFLDTIVKADLDLALQREMTAMQTLHHEPAAVQMFEEGDGKMIEIKHGAMDSLKKGDGDIEFLENGVVVEGSGKETTEKSIKRLSRLWKYLAGRSPKD